LDSWHDIDWLEVEYSVRQLRNQIFVASRENDLRRVGNLQKVMMRSQANRLLAVRRVTQINKGHRTPGVDKKTYETPQERLQLAKELVEIRVNAWPPPPVQRVYIPKGKTGKRPLGIPTQLDRCLQTIVKNALEPYWEARFEHYSFGFRPGRSTMDAINAILQFTMHGNRPIILDADIKGAFDHIAKEPLMEAIGNSPVRFIVRRWLEAGIMEGVEFTPTLAGTPQGGIISPLLANIALHGMQEAIGMVRKPYERRYKCPSVVVRYADDFVALSRTVEDSRKTKDQLQDWLAETGLAMSTEKTKTVHITEGFDFLGFNIRQYERKATTRKGFGVTIRPARGNIEKIKDELREVFQRRLHHEPKLMVMEINAKIRGWAGYYRPVDSRRTFRKLDEFLWHRSWRYAKRKHPQKNADWLKKKYFPEQWRLQVEGATLLRFQDFNFQRRNVLKIGASPDNPEEEDYWNERRSQPTIELRVKAKLWRKQQGLCEYCKGELDNGEEIAIDHKIPKGKGGDPHKLSNMALVHETCHWRKHYSRTA
jgi:RNA-directed DNA polymerase